MKTIKAEKCSTGRYDVMQTDEHGQYPIRIGYIVGGYRSFLAESGRANLGYHKTKKAAIEAIAKHQEGGWRP